MASTTTTSIIEALKYTYGADRVDTILNEEIVAWNLMKKKMRPVGGRGQFIIPLYTQFPEGISGITEGGALPTALAADTSEATFALQEITGMYDITWKLLQDAKTDKFAFEQAVTMLDRGIRTAMVQDLSNELLDDGRGRLASLSAADNNTSITNLDGHPRVRLGMVLDCMDTDNDTVHANSVTVTAVVPQTPSFTVSAAPSSTAAGDYFVRQDTCDDSQNDALHIVGMLAIVDDANPASVVGNYGNINRSTAGNEFWESAVLDNSGTNRPLTSDLLLQAYDNVRLKGGGKVDCILMNLPLRRRYVELFDSYRFVDTGEGAFKGDVGPVIKNSDTGATGFSFGGTPIKVDPFAAANTCVLLDSSTWMIGHGANKVPQPVSDLFDVPMFRQTTNATFQIAWYWQGQLICNNPAANSKIEDLSEA